MLSFTSERLLDYLDSLDSLISIINPDGSAKPGHEIDAWRIRGDLNDAYHDLSDDEVCFVGRTRQPTLSILGLSGWKADEDDEDDDK